MAQSIPEIIVENRRKLEKAYADEYNLTATELADIFQVPIRVIEKDVASTGITLLQKRKEEFDVTDIKKDLKKSIKNKNEPSREVVLAENGLWSEILIFGSDKKGMFSGVGTKSERKRMRKAYAMIEFGYTVDDVKRITGITRSQLQLLRIELKNANITDTFQNWAKEQYDRQEGKTTEFLDSLKGAVGASLVKIQKGRDYYAEKKASNNLPASVFKPKVSRAEREQKKKEIYDRWMNGKITQQELADEYKLTRVTIVNYIREKKIENIDEISRESRRRNLKSEYRAEHPISKIAAMSISDSNKEEVDLLDLIKYGPNKGITKRYKHNK